jgi:hypothetical protein
MMSGIACERTDQGARHVVASAPRAESSSGCIAENFRNAGYRASRSFAGRERATLMPGNGVIRFDLSLRPFVVAACGAKSTPESDRAVEIPPATALLQTCLTAAQLGARREASMQRNPIFVPRMRWTSAQADESACNRVMPHPRGEAEKQRYADL